MEPMWPELSDMKSPNVTDIARQGKKGYLGILEDLTFTITYGAQKMHLKAVFSPVNTLSRNRQSSLMSSRAL